MRRVASRLVCRHCRAAGGTAAVSFPWALALIALYVAAAASAAAIVFARRDITA